jgi:hypothetical protein
LGRLEADKTRLSRIAESHLKSASWIPDQVGNDNSASLRGSAAGGDEAISLLTYLPLAPRAEMRRAAADRPSLYRGPAFHAGLSSPPVEP